MEILVFENEIPAVWQAFKDVNSLDFANLLQVKYVDKSQDFDLRLVSRYKMVFIDIDLSSNSDKDGYEIIQDLKRQNFTRIIVLSGHNVASELQIRGFGNIDIVPKPIILDELRDAILKHSSP